jgi:Tfp pilus assembly protein PilO
MEGYRMSRAFLILSNETVRQKAVHWCQNAPARTRVEFKAPRRSLPQNARMWAMLTDVAQQVPWHGLKLTADDWKLIFLDALKREVRMVPNLDGNGFVSLGRSSSDLTKEEMGDLMELIAAFGANHGVVFQEAELLSEVEDMTGERA